MSKPKLFISHSTSTLPNTDRSVKLIECLCATLPEHGWDVFIDHNINPGDKWRMEILHNLAEANAGIILFNERAVSQSTWVADEALILCFRKSIDPNFQVIPVLLDGKSIKDTCFEKYAPFQLNEIQAIEDNTSLTPDEFSDKIVSMLDPSRAKLPPMSRWVYRVVSLLDEVKLDYLELAAKQLELSVKWDFWNKPEERRQNCLCRTVAEAMHYMSPMDCVGAFGELSGHLNDSKIEKFRVSLTAKWVANEAMEIILCASHKPREIGILTVNTGRQETINEYLRRARIEIPNDNRRVWAFSVSGGAGEGDDAILYQIERVIQEEIVGPEPLPGDDGKDLTLPQAVSEILYKQGDIAICSLPPEYAKDRILKELRQRYPKIVLIVQLGDRLKDPDLDLKCFNGIGGKPLLPPLNANKIRELARLKSHLRTTIKNC